MQVIFDVKKTKVNHLIYAMFLLTKFKHQVLGMVWCFSDVKNFNQDQKVNWTNDNWLCRDSKDILMVMHIKFRTTVSVLGIMNNEEDVMPPHFFPQSLRPNAFEYKECLDREFEQRKSVHLPKRPCNIS